MLKLKQFSMSTTRSCCVAFARKSEQHRNIVNFKRAVSVSKNPNKKPEHLFPRYFAGYISNPDDDHLRCWNCNEDFSHCVHSMIACSSCNAMRYPPTVGQLDYFDLFDLQKSYDVDLKVLANKFKALQRLFHPDLFANRTDKEKSLSESWSSLINEGYKTLQKPHLRANYLLELYGQPIGEGEVSMEPGLLLEIMELNEEISEAESRSDVIELMSRVKEMISDHEILTGKAFKAEDIVAAKKVVAKMSYYVNLRDQLIKKETELGIVN